jgi:hypothetical protein
MDKALSAARGSDDKQQKRPRADGGGDRGRRDGDKRGRREGDGGRRGGKGDGGHRDGRDGGRRDGGRRDGGRGGRKGRGGGGRGDGPRHRGGRGGRLGGSGPRREPDRDTVRFSYKWSVTPEKQRVLTVRAFGSELVKISSGGNLEVSSGGFRTWRTFQALNMLMAPVGLELEADPEGKGAGYRGGKWSLASKNGWTLPFEDDMKLSAFPTRDWRTILPQLESLPEDVEFVVAKD